jgi:hypothetical protein
MRLLQISRITLLRAVPRNLRCGREIEQPPRQRPKKNINRFLLGGALPRDAAAIETTRKENGTHPIRGMRAAAQVASVAG